MESPSEVLLSGHKASHRDMQQEHNFGKVVSTTCLSFSLEITGASKKVFTSIIILLHKQANI